MDTMMLIWMKLHLTSGFMIGKTRLKYRPVQVSVSRYFFRRVSEKYLYLDTFFGEYLKSILSRYFSVSILKVSVSRYFFC